ncbi:Chaperone protein HtpG [Candidatus Xenohaliotis californiensis]|uniref:Chaperone protein HtpG n=1 Tax=Candidatus Xenohaliotis californiensis TaxID=84677 RepID=A0ABP0ESN6_9RICK|nr:Chaperone protein HtpG [Candidatus Xenohaliotis californiensis]
MVEAKHKEKHVFDAEIGRVLDLVIHSLYTNEDIFLRELISNASDACDKLRYMAISNSNVFGDDAKLKICIKANKDEGSLLVHDNGIGMNHDDLVNNLGTIAQSGTQRFIEAMKQDKGKANDLIGQFGVGFYSVFMISDEVIVKSRKFDDNGKGWVWSSDGKDGFTITESDTELPRGTQILIKLKENKKEYLDRFRIEHIVTTYSDHVGFDIEWIDDEKGSDKLNGGAALWRKNKKDISSTQYNEFFRSVAHVGGEPWMILHNKSEGVVQYTNLLFIPKIKPFDLFHPDRRTNVKLYVNKVFITEDNVNLIPSYMRFLRGVVDSDDLPLNISRETLQNNSTVNKIRSLIVKKVLSELDKSAKSDSKAYVEFWDNFGSVLKEGLCEAMDTESRERILSVSRFYSSIGDELISLDDYLSRMKEQQKNIFFINADSIENARRSPQIEGFVSRGIEVLILRDPVDDFWTSVVQDYKGTGFKSVAISDIDLDEIAKSVEQDDSSAETEEDQEAVKLFLEKAKEILGDAVSEVGISKKLHDSPVCLAIKEGAMNSRMERMLIDQKQLSGSQKSAKILEINTKHPIIKNAIALNKDSDTEKVARVVHILFAEACVMENEEIVNKIDFLSKLNDLLCDSL